jgi:hypothetical protein
VECRFMVPCCLVIAGVWGKPHGQAPRLYPQHTRKRLPMQAPPQFFCAPSARWTPRPKARILAPAPSPTRWTAQTTKIFKHRA